MDEKDQEMVNNQDVIIVDDVISTGSTLAGLKEVVATAKGRVGQIAAVFTEGEGDWEGIVALGNLPVFTE